MNLAAFSQHLSQFMSDADVAVCAPGLLAIATLSKKHGCDSAIASAMYISGFSEEEARIFTEMDRAISGPYKAQVKLLGEGDGLKMLCYVFKNLEDMHRLKNCLKPSFDSKDMAAVADVMTKSLWTVGIHAEYEIVLQGLENTCVAYYKATNQIQ